MREDKISFDLLRTLAAEAWDQGAYERAAFLTAYMDRAMLDSLQQHEGRQVSADKVPLVVSADRA